MADDKKTIEVPLSDLTKMQEQMAELERKVARIILAFERERRVVRVYVVGDVRHGEPVANEDYSHLGPP